MNLWNWFTREMARNRKKPIQTSRLIAFGSWLMVGGREVEAFWSPWDLPVEASAGGWHKSETGMIPAPAFATSEQFMQKRKALRHCLLRNWALNVNLKLQRRMLEGSLSAFSSGFFWGKPVQRVCLSFTWSWATNKWKNIQNRGALNPSAAVPDCMH